MPDKPTMIPDELWQHVTSARWFAGKGRAARPGGLHVLDPYVDDPDLRVGSVVVEACFPDGTIEWYQVLLAQRPERGEGWLYELEGAEADARVHVHDALRDPDALRRLVDAIATQTVTDSWSSQIVRPVDLSGPLRVFGGEQSNTSVMVGDVAMIKFFRRLEAGANLDIAVHDALGRAGVDSVATLFGWLGASLPIGGDDETVQGDLAMIVQKLPEARDGWEVATASARDGGDFTADAAELGSSLATIHLALADTFPTAVLEASDLADGMVTRLHAAAAEAGDLEPLREPLETLFAGLEDARVPGQRVHGDFHLGQTLLTADGWRIIDFEGEPIKPLAERSLPDSRWRDVAGMLRSLAYATSACDDPDSPEAQRWMSEAQEAFMAAYCAQAQGGTMSSEDQRLLDAYVADKAIYEVVYETRNRPDWVDIPLRALRMLANERT